MTKTKLLLAIAAALAIAPLSKADIIYGSGQGVSPIGNYTIDPHWTVVALPVSYTISTAPYAAYNPATSNIPGVFASPNGYNAGGGVTNYWLSPNTTSASMQGGNYNWIVAQNFTITQAGVYNFNFQGAGDNAISFYINGSITGTNTELPTITGGTQIGSTWNSFSTIGTFTGSAFMNAGTNTAYMVLNDFGGNTAALITQSTFSAAVPEPGQVAASLLLLGGIGGYVFLKCRNAAKVASAVA